MNSTILTSPMTDMMNFAFDNPWIIFILSVVFAGLFFFIDYRKRGDFKYENVAGSDDEEGIKLLIKRDTKNLIISSIFLGVPYIVAFIIFLTNNVSDIIMYFFAYFLGAGIVFSIIRKDPILLFIWRIRTITLFGNYLDNTDDYEGEVHSDGRITFSRGNSFTTVFLFIIGLFLFCIKLTILFIYFIADVFANMILSVLVYPILYGILIGRNKKLINGTSGEPRQHRRHRNSSPRASYNPPVIESHAQNNLGGSTSYSSPSYSSSGNHLGGNLSSSNSINNAPPSGNHLG